MQPKNNFYLPWLLYGASMLSYILFNLMEIPLFGIEKKSITWLAAILISVSALYSLFNITNNLKQSISYIAYWFLIGYVIEFIMISNGMLSYTEEKGVVFGVVPIMVGFNWLIIFFAIYSLSTFASLLIKRKKNNVIELIQRLFIAGCFTVLYGLLIDPIGHQAGHFTLDTSSSEGLVWYSVPIQYFLIYFISLPLIFLPLVSWEVFKNPPKTPSFTRLFSYPLYFGWSSFAVLAYWAFRKEIEGIGDFALILLLFITIFIVFGQTRLRASAKKTI